MLVYNITIKVDKDIHLQWMDWMKTEYLPEHMDTGLFSSQRMLRILDIDETDGFTYALQFELTGISDFERYISVQSTVFQNNARRKWGEKMLSFATIMEVVY